MILCVLLILVLMVVDFSLDFKIVIYECSKILKCSLYVKNVIM